MERAAESTSRGSYLIVIAVLVLAILAGYGRLLVRVDYQDGDDLLTYAVPYSQYVWGSVARGESPLMNPHSDLGTPLWTSNPYMGPFYPLFVLYRFLPPGEATNLGSLLHLLSAALGMFLLLRRLSGGLEACAIGGLAFGLCGYAVMFVNQGYLPDLISLSYLPWIAWLLERGSTRLRSAAWAGVPIGLMLLGGHITNNLIVLGTAAAYALARGILAGGPRGRATAHRLAAFALALTVGLALAAVQWLPLAMDFASSAAAGGRPHRAGFEIISRPWRVLTYGLPLFDDQLRGNQFVGVVPLLLAAGALALRRDRALLVGLALALLGWLLLISPEIGLHDVLVRHVPLFGVLSYLLPFGLTLGFGLALAGGRGAAVVLAQAREEPERLGRCAWAAAGLGLVLLAGGAVVPLLVQEETGAEAMAARAVASLPLVGLALVLVVVLLALAGRGRLGARPLAVTLLLLVGLELALSTALTAEPPAPPFSMERFFAGGKIAAGIDRDGRRGRVLLQQTRIHTRYWALRPNESLVRRFDAANLEAKLIPPERLELSQRLRGMSLLKEDIECAAKGCGEPNDLQAPTLRVGGEPGEVNARLLDLAGVAYLVLDREREVLGGRFEPLAEDGTARVWVNRSVLPLARVVTGARVVEQPAVWDALLEPAHDPASTVLLAPSAAASKLAGQASAAAPGAAVTAVSRSPTVRTFDVDLPGHGALVLSEGYHSQWRAYVDDAEAEVLRADGAFIAIPLPPGPHRVRLEFSSARVVIGALLGLAALLGLGVLGFVEYRRRRGQGM